jgi:hypothetical protein
VVHSVSLQCAGLVAPKHLQLLLLLLPGLLDILQGPHLGSTLQLTALICLVSP